MLWMWVACAPRLPSAQVQDVVLTEIGWSQASAEVLVRVDNPLWVDVRVQGLTWDWSIADEIVSSGVLTEERTLTADGVTVFPVPVVLVYADLLRAAGAAGSDVPYAVGLQLVVDTPRGPVTLPVTHSGRLPRLATPELEFVAMRTLRDGTRFGFEMDLGIGLPDQIEVAELFWTLHVDQTELGRGGAEVNDDHGVTLSAWLDTQTAMASGVATLWGTPQQFDLGLTGAVDTPLGRVPLAWAQQISTGQQSGLATPGEPRSPPP